jgi:hypothetical protein
MHVFKTISAAVVASLCLLSSAMADVVSGWNEKVVAASVGARQSPAAQARNVAMVHLAMFDALNSIEPRYAPYRVQLPVPNTTSGEAAASAAAHYLIVRLYPEQKKDADAALTAALAAVPDGDPKAKGVQLGEIIAAAMLQDRSNDGANAPDTYRPFTVAGTYVPTVLPVLSNWGAVKPFAMTSGSQFRPVAPYALTSAQWAKDYTAGVTRSFSRLSDYVAEVIDARVFDGVHYRTSGDVGADMGRKIGQYVMQNVLKPVR